MSKTWLFLLATLVTSCGNSLTEGAYPGVPSLPSAAELAQHQTPTSDTGSPTRTVDTVTQPPSATSNLACTVTTSPTASSGNTQAFYDPNITVMQRALINDANDVLTVDNMVTLAGSVAPGSSQTLEVGAAGQCGVCVRGHHSGVAFEARLGSATVSAPGKPGDAMTVTIQGLVLVESAPPANTPPQVWCVPMVTLAAGTTPWPCGQDPFDVAAGATQCVNNDTLKESHILSCDTDNFLSAKRTCDYTYYTCKSLIVGGMQCVPKVPGIPGQ